MNDSRENFLNALAASEWNALGDLDNNRYCVVQRYGMYLCCRYDYALDHDYAIVCITI